MIVRYSIHISGKKTYKQTFVNNILILIRMIKLNPSEALKHLSVGVFPYLKCWSTLHNAG